MLLAAGFDAYGCDIRWPGADYRWDGPAAEQNRLSYFESGATLPYEDDTFDVVVSDQVFEHVIPLLATVAELERIVKPGGIMYHHFPAREVWREGHIGIPFAHRLPEGRARERYTTALRRLGAGIYKDDRPAAVWAREKLDWIDQWTVYRSAAQLHEVFGAHATIRHREIDYCRFRAGDHRLLQRMLAPAALTGLWQQLFRRLAFMAIECRLEPSEAQ